MSLFNLRNKKEHYEFSIGGPKVVSRPGFSGNLTL